MAAFAVQLQHGADNWGQVQVRHSGIWGQVCNSKWNDAAANVTCRQLNRGFIGGVAYGPVTRKYRMPFWLVDVRCRGNETSLDECLYTQWGEPLVFRCSPAYVLCYRSTGRFHFHFYCNFLSNDKNLSSFKLKVFADDKFYVF